MGKLVLMGVGAMGVSGTAVVGWLASGGCCDLGWCCDLSWCPFC